MPPRAWFLGVLLALASHVICLENEVGQCQPGETCQARFEIAGLNGEKSGSSTDVEVETHLKRICNSLPGSCSNPIPRFTTFRKEPLIRIYEDIFTPEEAAHFIAEATPHLESSQDIEAKHVERGGSKGGRTNQRHWLPRHHDAVVQTVVKRVSDIVGINSSHVEGPQVILYQSGQRYGPHHDGFNMSSERGLAEVSKKKGGQRVLTALGYLHSPDEGGNTCFHSRDPHKEELPLCVEPRAGRLLVFENCLKSNSNHRVSLHSGEPVKRGKKWAFNLWFREGARQVR